MAGLTAGKGPGKSTLADRQQAGRERVYHQIGTAFESPVADSSQHRRSGKHDLLQPAVGKCTVPYRQQAGR